MPKGCWWTLLIESFSTGRREVERRLDDLMFSLPLRKCFHDAGGVGPPLRCVVKAAALAVQAGNAPPVGGDEIRTRVLRVWGLIHGLVGLHRAGALKARSDRNAIQFIVDAARALAPSRRAEVPIDELPCSAVAPKSRISKGTPAMAHNFAINDDVHHQLQGPQGRAVVKERSVYTIVTCLPIEADGRPRYRIKSKTENIERVVTEEQISRLG